MPKPNITWDYQPLCTNATTGEVCSPNASSWHATTKNVGQSDFTHLEGDRYRSILTVSSDIESGFFQCTAVNALGDERFIYRVQRGCKHDLMCK